MRQFQPDFIFANWMLLFLFAYTEENFPTLYFPFSFFYSPYFLVYIYMRSAIFIYTKVVMFLADALTKHQQKWHQHFFLFSDIVAFLYILQCLYIYRYLGFNCCRHSLFCYKFSLGIGLWVTWYFGFMLYHLVRRIIYNI